MNGLDGSGIKPTIERSFSNLRGMRDSELK
jgi:hypothetical protein